MGEINITVSEELAFLIDEISIRRAKREIIREALCCVSGSLNSICEVDWEVSRLKELETGSERLGSLIQDLAELDAADEAERDGREVVGGAK